MVARRCREGGDRSYFARNDCQSSRPRVHGAAAAPGNGGLASGGAVTGSVTLKIDLSGKVAIVTGSTGGIGFAIAHGLAACGATVVVNGRKRSAVDKATADMRSGAPEAEVRGVVADLSTANGCDALVKAEPACDILVNNV